MKIDITHIAKLANLKIEESEKEMFAAQLSSILEHIEKLSEVDTTGVEETSQVTGLTNVLRDDQATLSLTQAEALAPAAHTHKGYFAVKGIFDNE